MMVFEQLEGCMSSMFADEERIPIVRKSVFHVGDKGGHLVMTMGEVRFVG